MKYAVKNLRTNKFMVIYDDLDMAEHYIKISVMYKNEKKLSSEKRWTKNDFEIWEVK